MALESYLILKGARQGLIQGDVKKRGHENEISIIGVSHDIVSPRDPASGLPTGKRMHKPLIITKELDRSSPMLHQAMSTNEIISEFTLKFFGVREPDPAEKNIYTIKLENASIAAIHFEKSNIRKPENTNLLEFEIVSFVYESIEWTWNEGNILSKDEWSIGNT